MSLTHCPAGHEYDETNTARHQDGRYHCRTCANDRKRAKRAALRLLRDDRPRWVQELGDTTGLDVIRVALSGGAAHALIDAADLHLVADRSWQFDTTGYAKTERRRNGARTKIYMHRLVLGAVAGQEVDHINRDRLDNRRSNLRLASRWQQSGNTGIRSNNTSGFKGVSLQRSGRWGAWIRIDGRSTALGTFGSPESAACAYDAAARAHFGEFANLNFPEMAA